MGVCVGEACGMSVGVGCPVGKLGDSQARSPWWLKSRFPDKSAKWLVHVLYAFQVPWLLSFQPISTLRHQYSEWGKKKWASSAKLWNPGAHSYALISPLGENWMENVSLGMELCHLGEKRCR